MVDANPLRFWSTAKLSGGELALRICSALVLAPLALGIAYLGGWTFVVFWLVAALVVFWEWTSLVAGRDQRPILMAGGAAVLLAIVLAGSAGDAVEGVHKVRLVAAIIVLVMGMLGIAALTTPAQRAWAAGGIPYAGAIGIAAIVLRSDVALGFVAIVFLFAIVWATDIFAYFVGRAVGGPKLAPRFSPKKTWSGAIAGVVAATVVALVIARVASLNGVLPIAMIAVLLSVAAQLGDLFESVLKRRFGAKDASQLIPGHGGLMDRLDGFVAAAVLAAVIGLARGGLEAPARGLLMW
jgi:phosphatidate cytidylyltransferase